MTGDAIHSGTWVTFSDNDGATLNVRCCRLEVVAGADVGMTRDFTIPTIRVGAQESVDFVLSDRKVSGVHLEISLDDNGYRVRDLASTNGTFVHGVQLFDAYVPPGTTLKIGKSELRLVPLTESVAIPLSNQTSFYGLVGKSVAMRRLYSAMERFAASDATVMITGETGVGKELVAEAIHCASPRANGPFVILDCGAIPANLMENELFGHERGAFTNATNTTPGAFERANGGTLFLDELGELPVEMQPKLLRAVQTHKVRRIGGDRTIDCDIRLVAATNRDLAIEVNRGSFRSDLYYRLAVARLEVPPLRDRRDDVPLLIECFLDQLPGGRDRPLPADFGPQAIDYYWPGNVRELRNAVERAVLLPNHPPEFRAITESGLGDGDSWPPLDIEVPFKLAKKQFVDEFDKRFMRTLLDNHDWNISAAARATGVDRMSIYKLLQRLGLERK